MAISYPTSLDTFTNPTSTDTLDSPSHSTQHANVNDAVEALEAKVGVDSSAVTTSHDYKLSGVTGSDKAVSLAGTETLTNKTLTSPSINSGVMTTPQINDTSADHQYIFAVSELAADRTVTLPLLTGNDTFVFEAHSQTLTNKTINADNNTVSELETDNFKANVIDNDATLSADSSTRLPTQSAVKSYVDTQTATGVISQFGSGADGSATISSNTTLTEDKYYTNLTIDAAVTLTTAGYRIYVLGTLTNNGTIDNSGADGVNGGDASVSTPGIAGTGGAGGAGGTLDAGSTGTDGTAGNETSASTDGTDQNPSLGVNGAQGGTGGDGDGASTPGTAGAAGTATSENCVLFNSSTNEQVISANTPEIFNLPLHYQGATSGLSLSPSAGSSGGTGGSPASSPADACGGGGGAGGSGGIVYIFANTITNNGTISADGGNGGNGGDGVNNGGSAGGGGGAGGSGGVIVLGYNTITVGTISVAGGTGGTGGTGNGGGARNGSAGGAGNTGNIYRTKVNSEIA